MMLNSAVKLWNPAETDHKQTLYPWIASCT